MNVNFARLVKLGLLALAGCGGCAYTSYESTAYERFKAHNEAVAASKELCPEGYIIGPYLLGGLNGFSWKP